MDTSGIYAESLLNNLKNDKGMKSPSPCGHLPGQKSKGKASKILTL